VLARNWRNAALPVLVLILGALAIGLILAASTNVDFEPRHIAWISVDLITLIMVIVGGRVIPAFTRNALPDARVRSYAWLEWLALASTAAVVVADAGGWAMATSLIAFAAGLANGIRLLGWSSASTRRHPLLLVLHAGYGWVGVGLVFRLVDPAGDAALHALTTGAIGTLTLGMMSRVALGHTGRPLVAAPPTVVAFILVQVAAVFRLGSQPSPEILTAAAASWTLAFLLFVATYAPILVRPRADGRPG
jgi:uncharacterized protein involved in response to NO